MIIKGNRRGGARQLAAHLLRRDTNDTVQVRDIDGYPVNGLTDIALIGALRLMEAQGTGQGNNRVLYHVIIAPQAEEFLTDTQLRHAIDALANSLGLAGHTRVVVEHRKDGRQHFHAVFNILDQNGKAARLQWTRKKEWATARQLEQDLALKPVVSEGRAEQRWECERGRRSGIDPLVVRTEVTAIYRASKTGKEFIAMLAQAGYALTTGRNGGFVIVDQAGHVHGLMRRIEGAKLDDVKRKFPDLVQMSLPPLEFVKEQNRRCFVARRSGKSANNRRRDRPAFFYRPLSRRAVVFYGGLYGSCSALVRDRRRAALEERKAAFRALAGFITYRPKPEKTQSDPRPVRPWLYDRDAETARIIAWAFRTGRLDILALYGIFLPADFFG